MSTAPSPNNNAQTPACRAAQCTPEAPLPQTPPRAHSRHRNAPLYRVAAVRGCHSGATPPGGGSSSNQAPRLLGYVVRPSFSSTSRVGFNALKEDL